LSSHQLPRRRAAAEDSAFAAAAVSFLSLLLPASDRRADRSHLAIAVAARAGSPHWQRHVVRRALFRARFFSESRGREQSRAIDRPLLGGRRRRLVGGRSLGHRLSLLLPDLQRFRRLQPDGARHGAASRLSLAGEFPRADACRHDAGILAPLAHHAVALATRLSLHLDGW